MACSIVIRGSTAEVVPRPTAIIAVLSDIHFPHEDPDAMRLARTIVQEAKPDVVVIAGDAADFFGISRYPVSPLRRAHFAVEYPPSEKFFKKFFENPRNPLTSAQDVV